MENMMPKVKFLRDNFSYLNIQVDGGVGPKTIHTCAQHGANMIVSGTAIINSKNRRETIMELKKVVEDQINIRKN